MLRQNTGETQSAWQHTPPTPSPPHQRFDKEAATEILETAARLQSGEQETLTQEEIESLAAEMGISPCHVRQAIALSQQGTSNSLAPIRLGRREKHLALFTPLIYGLYMTGLVLATSNNSNSGFPYLLIMTSLFVVPFLLSAWLGWQLRYKRAGAAVGIWVLASILVGIVAGISIHEGILGPRHIDEISPLIWMLIGALVSGTGGAALRQWHSHRQPPYQPTAVRPSDLDR